MDILKAAGKFADGVLDIFNETAKRLESPGRETSRDSILGSIGEVSTIIEKGSQGEVSVVLSGVLHHYPARALRPEDGFQKGTKVRIADVGANLLYVEPYQPKQEPTRIEIIE